MKITFIEILFLNHFKQKIYNRNIKEKIPRHLKKNTNQMMMI